MPVFERIKKSVLRDLQTAAESKYTDGPRDALIHNYLLVEVCDRLEKLSEVMHTVGQEVRNARVDRIREMQAPTYRQLQEDQHDGIMIAFFVDPGVAKQLAIPGGEKAEDLHVTLAYLGDANRDPDVLTQLKDLVGQFAQIHDSISGQIGGIGRFTPSEHSDNLSPVVALVNVPGLQSWRRRLADALDLYSFDIADDFDFLPHITLAYIGPDDPSPVHTIEALPLTFDTLWLCIGDERIPYKLGKQEETYYYKVEALDKDGKVIEFDKEELSENTFQQEYNGAFIDNEPTTTHEEERDYVGTWINGKLVNERQLQESKGPDNHYDKVALAAAMSNFINDFHNTSSVDRDHLGNAIATAYLDAQHYAYNKAMAAIGIKTAQEGIIGRIASGIKTTFDQALSWAKEQVQSIVGTLQDALDNFISDLGPDLSSDDIDSEVSTFLQGYATWKAPQVANYTYGSGLEAGTQQAIADIMEEVTSADSTLVASTIRVRVIPSESSGDYCKNYAGQSYSLDEYNSLGVSFPAHPNCIHSAEIFMEGE